MAKFNYKVLMHGLNFVDEARLSIGIYTTSQPHLRHFEDSIGSIIEKREYVFKSLPLERTSYEQENLTNWKENLCKCKLVNVELLIP